MHKIINLSFIFLLTIVTSLSGQVIPKNWMNMDSQNGYYGISAEKAYQELLGDRKSKTVVVAVIDSGVDIEHEDLRENIWINMDEIPDNGIDDDKNGYVDDVHGWNFIGGPDGKNVDGETLEYTRIYAHLRDKYKNVNPIKLSDDEKKEYAKYLTYGKKVKKEREKAQEALSQIEPIYGTVIDALDAISVVLPDDYYTTETLDTLAASDQMTLIGRSILMKIINDEGVDSLPVDEIVESVKSEISYERDYYKLKLDYQWNPDYDSRKEIVKDDYSNGEERYYGNNDVEGPDARHGTHVAGIIAAMRNNDVGMDGVANNVKIMSIRTVPDGDERDKDVANAIRYAVDNGASIINMSFGKGQSWDKDLVDDAVKYAVKNDVLLIHAAGNSSQDNDVEDNFPNDEYRKKGWFLWRNNGPKTWIEVGALSHRQESDLVARFSNYGKENVDIFAPGEAIYSTVPDDKYEYLQGTSMAAPVVAGAAATLRSYFPTLDAEQVKEILLKSAKTLDIDVKIPGKEELVPFSDLSVTGGIVNLYDAVKLAMKTKGNKKIEDRKDRA